MMSKWYIKYNKNQTFPYWPYHNCPDGNLSFGIFCPDYDRLYKLCTNCKEPIPDTIWLQIKLLNPPFEGPYND